MSSEERKFTEKLKAFLHDPIDKCFDIPGHEKRAESYAKLVGVSRVRDAKGPDMIASCMERSLLPPRIAQTFNEIRHPLSEGFLEVPGVNPSIVFSSISSTYDQISKEIYSWDDMKKFFYLWRNLLDSIFDKARDGTWVKYLPILPADTRVPDHSIWEHIKIASSILASYASSMLTSYEKGDRGEPILTQDNSLFLFSIGPVQSFIAQARKTQDFYMGSFILSFLTFKAVEVVIDEFGPTNIVYPDLYKQPLVDWWIKKNLNFDPIGFSVEDLQLPTIPNRFVAILPTTEKSKIQSIVNQMREKLQELIFESTKIILQHFNIDLPEETKQKIKFQISEFPQINWTAVPWRVGNKDIFFDDLKDVIDHQILKRYSDLWNFAEQRGEFPPNIGLMYELIYSILERFLGARKNLRAFEQTNEKGRKCSVCGERDVVFFRETQNKSKFTRYNKHTFDLTDKIPLKYVSDGEGLCAMCFLKRTFEIYLQQVFQEKEGQDNVFRNVSFPSTAEIASADFKERMMETERAEYENYLKALEKYPVPSVQPLKKIKHLFEKNIEGAFFYEENISEKYISQELGISPSADQVNKLKRILKNIIEKVGEPNPYYAIIYLDGDDMGRWLSGELLPEIEYSYNSDVWRNLPPDFKKELKSKTPRKPLTPAIHASVSAALRNYALEFVKKIVEEEHLGKLVYAGGDDVLAFVNLRDLLDVIHKLRWAFSGHVKVQNNKIIVDLSNETGFVEKDGMYLVTMGPRATASVGVVIAHFKTPLQIVVKKVFDANKEAKERGKDCFSICLMRRSGEERKFHAKWSYDGKDTIVVLKKLAQAFDEKNQDGYISKSFIKKISESFVHLKDSEGRFTSTDDVFNFELRRLIERSFISQGATDKSRVVQFKEDTWQEMRELFWNTGRNVDNFVNLCIILAFLLKAQE